MVWCIRNEKRHYKRSRYWCCCQLFICYFLFVSRIFLQSQFVVSFSVFLQHHFFLHFYSTTIILIFILILLRLFSLYFRTRINGHIFSKILCNWFSYWNEAKKRSVEKKICKMVMAMNWWVGEHNCRLCIRLWVLLHSM